MRSGARPRLAAIAALTLAHVCVNALSMGADRVDSGLPALGWELWLWELSSWVGFLAVLPLVRRAARAFRPPRLPWPAAPLAHLPVAMLFSAGHVAIMLAIRQAVYSGVGQDYDYFRTGPAGELIYEFRKDIVFYAACVGVLLLVRGPAPIAGEPPAPPRRIEVRDGSRTIWLSPEEIVSAEAAGNYVELVTAQGVLLHRATLVGMESALGPDLVRVHRSRLVRRDAIRALQSTSSGDFELVLTDGRVVQGSRRYRDRLQL